MSFYSSSFYSDGYQDALAGREPAAPEGVHGSEYQEGYRDGLADQEKS